jgi:predicted kinase
MRSLFLIGGLPGCGKTTLASILASGTDSPDMFAADDYFVGEDGVYRFNPKNLPQAHEQCQGRTADAMEGLAPSIVVHNTFSQRWEMEPYFQMASRFGYRVTVVSLFDGGCTDEELAERNEHGVPADGIARMRARWEHDWGTADTRPPWER